MPFYTITTERFGDVSLAADNIAQARKRARAMFPRDPHSVTREASTSLVHRRCDACDSTPCCCPPKSGSHELAPLRLEWNGLSENSITDPDADPPDAYHGSTIIGGVWFHVEAIRVHEVAGEQRAVDPVFEDDLEHAYAITGDGPFLTTTIKGAEYVVLIYPHTA